MTRMNIKAGAKLHNKHHLILTDAKTGEIKQEGFAENIILDQGFKQLIDKHFKGKPSTAYSSDGLFGYSTSYGCFGTTFLGSGTTDPSATQTQLASYITRKTNGHYSYEYDMDGLMASQTRRAIWNETEIQNTTITEVGLGVDDQTTGLATRALIKDSEGNQISISKGTLDILTVYSTVYIQLSHAYGDNFKFVEGAPLSGGSNARNGMYNFLLLWVAYNGLPINSDSICARALALAVGSNGDPITSADPPVKAPITENHGNYQNADVTYDGTNKQIKFVSLGTGGMCRFGASQGNHANGIREIGMAIGSADTFNTITDTGMTRPLFRAVMPLAGVWPGTTITDEELGTGDSTTVLFQTTWAPVLTGTDVVKVAGVTQTRDTDYTIDLATGEITFDTAPGTGDSVTCTYGIEQIPKDSNHVLDIGFTIQFADGSV